LVRKRLLGRLSAEHGDTVSVGEECRAGMLDHACDTAGLEVEMDDGYTHRRACVEALAGTLRLRPGSGGSHGAGAAVE
jgi:hypothetical protein